MRQLSVSCWVVPSLGRDVNPRFVRAETALVFLSVHGCKDIDGALCCGLVECLALTLHCSLVHGTSLVQRETSVGNPLAPDEPTASCSKESFSYILTLCL